MPLRVRMIRPILSLERLSFLEQEGKVDCRYGRDELVGFEGFLFAADLSVDIWLTNS